MDVVTPEKPDGAGTAPAMTEWVQFMQAKCDKDVVDVLESGGIEPQDIDVIILRFVCLPFPTATYVRSHTHCND